MSTVNFYKNITIFSRMLSLLHSVLIFTFLHAIINKGKPNRKEARLWILLLYQPLLA